MIVVDLNTRMPPNYRAAPRVHFGAEFEVDVAAYDREGAFSSSGRLEAAGGGTATAVWTPPQPTLALDVDLQEQDEYEVRVYDQQNRLVAAIEIVSPADKDRPEHRSTFAAKCATLLRHGLSVSIVDVVTARTGNLYLEMLDLLGEEDPSLPPDRSPIYASTCRYRHDGGHWKLESWAHPLEVGSPLPTLPLWLASDLAVPLELEQSYQETCRLLRFP